MLPKVSAPPPAFVFSPFLWGVPKRPTLLIVCAILLPFTLHQPQTPERLAKDWSGPRCSNVFVPSLNDFLLPITHTWILFIIFWTERLPLTFLFSLFFEIFLFLSLIDEPKFNPTELLHFNLIIFFLSMCQAPPQGDTNYFYNFQKKWQNQFLIEMLKIIFFIPETPFSLNAEFAITNE